MGIFAGIVTGASLAAVLPTSLSAGTAPGYLNILVSALMMWWLQADFADRAMLPVGKKAGDAPDVPVPWLHVNLVGFAQFFGWVGFVAVEGSLSLIVVREYGFTHQNVLAVWGPTSAAMLCGTFLFAQLHKAKWRAWHIAATAIVALPVSALSLFSDQLSGQPRTAPNAFTDSYLSIGSTRARAGPPPHRHPPPFVHRHGHPVGAAERPACAGVRVQSLCSGWARCSSPSR